VISRRGVLALALAACAARPRRAGAADAASGATAVRAPLSAADPGSAAAAIGDTSGTPGDAAAPAGGAAGTTEAAKDQAAIAGTALPGRIRLLVGASPGSAPDTVARGVAPFLARQLPGVAIEIQNLTGEAGLTAMQALADAPPSGATLGWVASPTLPARMVDRGAPDLLSRLRLLGAVQEEPIAFVSLPATSDTSVQDLVRRSSEDADAVPLGTPPPGSPPHLAALRLQALAGTRLNIVTFPSSAAARAAAIGGNVAAAALGMAVVVDDLREDRLSGLGIAASARMDTLPDIPVLQEAGLDLAAAITRGLAAPSGLPDALAATLAAALQAVAADPDFVALAETGGFLANWTDGPAWTALVGAEQARLAAVWATEAWLPSAGQ
jgi:tripartite-type tricarboxylate transporter receptor subunit TctC